MLQQNGIKLLFLFDKFTVDTDRRELRRESELRSIEPQVFDVLEYLIRNRDRVVSKDDLLAAIWKGRIVSEATLTSRINTARKVIGDNGEDQRLIRTVPRKGIRFVGEVREQQSEPALAQHPAHPLSLPDKPSIGVLPFQNLSGDPEQEYFADGMVEEIITALSRMRGLFVIARNSSFTYKDRTIDVKQVGHELGVRYVLEGSVRRAGSRVRITAQLIDAVTGAHLWADRFDGDISDVFELQDRITENVVAAIEPTIELAEIERLKRKPAVNVDAYDLLLRALQLERDFTDESLAAAVQCLEEALAIDPSYAPAMALASYCYAQRQNQGWVCDPEGQTKWLRLAWRAAELGKDDANVLWMAAYAVWRLGGDPKSAKELAHRSLLINPNSTIALTMCGWMEAMTANPDKAFEVIERARRLNPRTPRDWFVATAMAMACFAVGKLDETVLWAEKALIQNRRFAVALRIQAAALAKLGHTAKAANLVREILQIEPKLTVSALRARLTFQDERFRNDLCDCLRIAGLPE